MNRPTHADIISRLIHWLNNDQTPKFTDEEIRKLRTLKSLIEKWLG